MHRRYIWMRQCTGDLSDCASAPKIYLNAPVHRKYIWMRRKYIWLRQCAGDISDCSSAPAYLRCTGAYEEINGFLPRGEEFSSWRQKLRPFLHPVPYQIIYMVPYQIINMVARGIFFEFKKNYFWKKYVVYSLLLPGHLWIPLKMSAIRSSRSASFC